LERATDTIKRIFANPHRYPPFNIVIEERKHAFPEKSILSEYILNPLRLAVHIRTQGFFCILFFMPLRRFIVLSSRACNLQKQLAELSK